VTFIIQLRGDSAARWTSVNPVLHARELGVETDTGHTKLGDGATPWTSLPYWSVSPAYLALSGGQLTGALAGATVTLLDQAVIVADASLGNDFQMTITANRTMGPPLNPRNGQLIMFDITQGGLGGFTVTWDAIFNFGSGTAPQLSLAAGATDMVGFKYKASKNQWWYTGCLTGY
jgi:hypothetical protein